MRKAPHARGRIDATLAYLESQLGISDDYIVRMVEVGNRSGACLFVETICDHKTVEETLRSLHTHTFPRRLPKNAAQYLTERVLPGSNAVLMTNLFEIAEAVAAGSIALIVDKIAPAIIIGAKYVEHRLPGEPFLESSSRGSQVSFVENIDINVGLVRTGLVSNTLVVKKFKVGYRSHRNVALLYIRDIANPELVKTVTQRIEAIHIDMISGAAAIEQRIGDHPWSLFPVTRVTQRIDNTIRELNQGKVVLMADGDPSVLHIPATVQDFFQTEEDYVNSWIEATFIRWLRILAFVLALYLPALYIAFVDFNPELLPKVLGLQIARSREGVPFAAVIEVLMMLLIIEILREATLRMPKQMGQTIGIVGGLVVGQAAVEAGIVSNILIIVVALTAISVFVTPSYEFTTVIRLCGWVMVGAATLVGFYGIVLASLWLLFEVGNTKAFGVSYLDPFGGEHSADVFRDGLLRMPVTTMDKRAQHLQPTDATGNSDYTPPMRHPQLARAAPTRGRRKGRTR